eukprot:TRINITY_DN5500_c0_g1_i3.p2 TRINITY_DN5500_c0_g1~~TRINITY_DN5500_c0_g1_i3.p2  ORF type:complete len:254 (+),score=36.68 TRINITY_DN5500_c0_g1_i3:96-857(+)
MNEKIAVSYNTIQIKIISYGADFGEEERESFDLIVDVSNFEHAPKKMYDRKGKRNSSKEIKAALLANKCNAQLLEEVHAKTRRFLYRSMLSNGATSNAINVNIGVRGQRGIYRAVTVAQDLSEMVWWYSDEFNDLLDETVRYYSQRSFRQISVFKQILALYTRLQGMDGTFPNGDNLAKEISDLQDSITNMKEEAHARVKLLRRRFATLMREVEEKSTDNKGGCPWDIHVQVKHRDKDRRKQIGSNKWRSKRY